MPKQEKSFDEKEWLKNLKFVIGEHTEEEWLMLLALIEQKVRHGIKTQLKEERQDFLNRLKLCLVEEVDSFAIGNIKDLIQELKNIKS